MWAGTKYFAAPEQMVDIRSVTPQSDVYGLAATTVYAVAGHAPYNSGTAQYWLHGNMPDLDGVPDSMYELLENCLVWNPADRPTVSDLLEAALPRLLDQGVALFTDTVPPLGASYLAAIMRHEEEEEAGAVSAVPPPNADGESPDDDAAEALAAYEAEQVAPGYLVTASSWSSGSPYGAGRSGGSPDPGRPGGSAGPGRPLGGHWAEQWNTAIDKRQDRYDG
jgi:serine/threonine protein kinase